MFLSIYFLVLNYKKLQQDLTLVLSNLYKNWNKYVLFNYNNNVFLYSLSEYVLYTSARWESIGILL